MCGAAPVRGVAWFKVIPALKVEKIVGWFVTCHDCTWFTEWHLITNKGETCEHCKDTGASGG